MKGSVFIIRWTQGPPKADVQVSGQFSFFGRFDWNPIPMKWCTLRKEYILCLKVPKNVKPMVKMKFYSLLRQELIIPFLPWFCPLVHS